MNQLQYMTAKDRIEKAIQVVLESHSETKDLNISFRHSGMSPAGFTTTITVNDPSFVEKIVNNGGLNNDLVKMGCAPPGTPILYTGKNGHLMKGTIVKARTKKYLFTDMIEGKNYIIPFRACQIDMSRIKPEEPLKANVTVLDRPALT